MGVAQPPAETPQVADPAEETSPNPVAPVTPDEAAQPTPEGDAASDAEGDEYEPTDEELAIAQRVFKAKRFAPVIEEVVAERLTEREPELTAQAEQKALTRNREMEGAERTRLKDFEQAELDADDAAKAMFDDWDNGYTVPKEEGEARMRKIMRGGMALLAREQEAAVVEARKARLGELTEEEAQQVDDSYYQYRRNGRAVDHVLELWDLDKARWDAKEKDYRKQLGDRKVTVTAAERLAAAAEAAGPSVGAETPAPRPSTKAVTYEQLTKMSEKELARFSDEEVAEITARATAKG